MMALRRVRGNGWRGRAMARSARGPGHPGQDEVGGVRRSITFEAMNGQSKRRRVVTNEPEQRRLILAMVGPLNVCLSVILGLITFFCFRIGDEASSRGIVLRNLDYLYVSIALLVVVLAAFAFALSIKISHRISGPMRNFGATLRAFREGDRSRRVKLRKGDYLGPVADELNGFLDWVDQGGESEADGEAAGALDDVPAPLSQESEAAEPAR
jgi:methyl-accepting chemotaxis protein